MTFNKISWFFPIIVITILLIYFFMKKKTSFFLWVKDHWDFNESSFFRYGEYLLITSFIALAFLFLDPRGTPRKVKADIQTVKTIIMIDTSSSMLVEDVRPNRLGKAVILAKHFVKNAVGQQIAIMVFSDTYKKIVPFTSDIDLLEARLDTLEDLRINAGGTALKLSITEAIQYLKVESKDKPSGNIVAFTDAEENDSLGELKVPESVTLAMVGVGTAKGGVIPIRNKKGTFKRNKKHNGQLVVSKLNEKVLKDIVDEVPVGNYWVASNYSIPTNEILDFFARSQKERERKGQVLVKPLMILPFFLLFFCFFIISSFLKLKKPIVMLFFLSFNLYGQELNEDLKSKKSDPPPRNEQVIELEKKLNEGSLSIKEKKDLAYLYLKNGEVKNAETLYNEVPVAKDEISVRFNHSKSQLQNNKFDKGFKGLEQLKKDLGEDPKYEQIKKNINSEILTHLKRKKGQDQQKKEDKKKQKQDQQKKDKPGSDGKGDSKDKKKDQQKKKSKDQQKKENKDKKKDGDKKNKKDKKKQKQDQKNSRSKQRMKIKKLPALLKQLMSEDRKLQKKFLDTSTQERGGNKKDW